MLRWIFVLLLCTYFACYGRHEDKKKFEFLSSDTPSLLVFGAGWCGPCRAEIPLINEVHETYRGQISVQGFLVEGNYNGETPDQESLDSFVDRNGDRFYSLLPDPEWRLFLSLDPPEAQKLPMIVFLNANQDVLFIKQGAIKHDELFALIETLLLGQKKQEPQSSPLPEPSTSPDPQDEAPDAAPGSSPTPSPEVVAEGTESGNEQSAGEDIEPSPTETGAPKPAWPTTFPVGMNDWVSALKKIDETNADALLAKYEAAFVHHRDEQWMTEYFSNFEDKAKVVSAVLDQSNSLTSFVTQWEKLSEIPDGPTVRCILKIPFSYDGTVEAENVEASCTPLSE